MGQQQVKNWKRSITCRANSVEVVHDVDDIVRIAKDRQRARGGSRDRHYAVFE